MVIRFLKDNAKSMTTPINTGPEQFKEWGLYKIGNMGTVKRAGRIIVPTRTGTGYLVVSLTVSQNKRRTFTVGRLVAWVWLDCWFRPYRYKNGDKVDNRVENLQLLK